MNPLDETIFETYEEFKTDNNEKNTFDYLRKGKENQNQNQNQNQVVEEMYYENKVNNTNNHTKLISPPPPSNAFADLMERDELSPSMIKEEDDILRSWQIFTKMKNVVHNGNRFENASWRRWHQKRNGVKVSSFPGAENFRPYTDCSVFKVLTKFDNSVAIKQIIDKSLEEEQTQPAPNSPPTAEFLSQKSQEKKRTNGLGLFYATKRNSDEDIQNHDKNDEEEDEEDEEESENFRKLVLSPPSNKYLSKRKCKKTVRFDESLNLTTFLGRSEQDLWVPGVYENADEYCKLERRRRGLIQEDKHVEDMWPNDFSQNEIVTEKANDAKVSTSNSPLFSALIQKESPLFSSLRTSSPPKSTFFTSATSSSPPLPPPTFSNYSTYSFPYKHILLVLEVILALFFELGIFLEWCNSMRFK